MSQGPIESSFVVIICVVGIIAGVLLVVAL